MENRSQIQCYKWPINSKQWQGTTLWLHVVWILRTSGSKRHLSPPRGLAKMLSIRPWPIRQNGLAPVERYHTLVTTVSRSKRKGTPLGYLKLAVIGFVWRGDMTYPVLWQQGKGQVCTNCFTRWGVDSYPAPVTLRNITHSGGQRANHKPPIGWSDHGLKL